MARQLGLLVAAGALLAGCANNGSGPSQANTITITPNPAILSVTSGLSPAQVTFTAVAHLASGDVPVSSSSFWYIDDFGMGSMSGPTFTSVTNRGGTTLVHATYAGAGTTSPITGQATLTVAFKVNVTRTCPGCPTFPADNAPGCSGAGANIVYPPDGVLLPPNMSVIDTQFSPGVVGSNGLFEIDFQN